MTLNTTADDLRRVTELEAFLADGSRWCREAWSKPSLMLPPGGPMRMCLVGSWMHLHLGVPDPADERYDGYRGYAVREVGDLLQIDKPVAYNDCWGHAKVMATIARARRRLLAEVEREQAAEAVPA
jgi:hypothetical protein